MNFYDILFQRHNAEKIPYSKTYFDTLFAEKLKNLEIKTLTGTLPLTFTAKGGNAADWTISGNDNVGANKFNFADTSKVDGNTTFTADGASGTITASGLPDTSSFISIISTDTFAVGDYTFTGDAGAGSTTHYMYVRKEGSNTTIANDYGEDKQNFTLTEATKLNVFCRMASTNPETTHIFRPMICKQGETPSTFEPYQVGVGEKTKNIADLGGIDTTYYGVRYYEENGYLRAVGKYNDNAAHTQPRFYYQLDAGSYVVSGSPDYTQTGVGFQIGTCTDAQGSNYIQLGSDIGAGFSFTLENASWIVIRIYTARTLHDQDIDLTIPLMLRKADTTPKFIPYGYQVPITVSQDGETDKNYEIFVGSAPLGEGETVSKTSTGIDIELFEGSNTVSTTLTNKPEMTIKYK